ncbi:hypothetical protein PR003_g22173 [Phytophthora rubi]|uniref:Secreted protein n=1 Tax=Phytophthora rubi TaxID=129364 RepID=A0A6A3LBV8_9STRA|nr:hypothetical protein PR001_g21033 [Phytophthora rubi]KAE9016921.1 hypothetical protein PR002_g13544 [Phytophthora rubi]KAE9302775.1 hypothetical protein PR003_g22173 [Phytophthora rubi]
MIPIGTGSLKRLLLLTALHTQTLTTRGFRKRTGLRVYVLLRLHLQFCSQRPLCPPHPPRYIFTRVH